MVFQTPYQLVPLQEVNLQNCASKGRHGHQTWVMIRRPLGKVEMMQIINCPAYFTSLHPVQLSLLCGGSKENYERTELGTERTHGQLYTRRSTAAGARPCERCTEKWKRCKRGQIKILTAFSTRKIDAATTQIPSLPKRTSRTASTRTSSCSTFDQSMTEFARPTFRERTATFQAFGGGSRRSTPITSLASTPACQEVSRDEVSPYRRWGRTSAT